VGEAPGGVAAVELQANRPEAGHRAVQNEDGIHPVRHVAGDPVAVVVGFQYEFFGVLQIHLDFLGGALHAQNGTAVPFLAVHQDREDHTTAQALLVLHPGEAAERERPRRQGNHDLALGVVAVPLLVDGVANPQRRGLAAGRDHAGVQAQLAPTLRGGDAERVVTVGQIHLRRAGVGQAQSPEQDQQDVQSAGHDISLSPDRISPEDRPVARIRARKRRQPPGRCMPPGRC
jgi:hypothetical protein